MTNDFKPGFKSHSVSKKAPELRPLKKRGERSVSLADVDQAIEAAQGQSAEDAQQNTDRPKEVGGPKGPEPTRYGDWEVGGIASDF